MKYLGLLFVCLYSFSIWANVPEVDKIRDQFANRNWGYHATVYAKKQRLADYSDVDANADIITITENLIKDIETELLENLNLFYPELEFEEEGDRGSRVIELESLIESSELLLNWENLLDLLGTSSWEDPDSANCDLSNPINDSDCGRRTKASFVLTHLTDDQKNNIETLKKNVLSDLLAISNEKIEFAVGPEIARFYQVIMDDKALMALIQKRYLEIGQDYESDGYKTRFIELARALVVQAFLDQDGKLLTTELKEIDLEDDDCNQLGTSSEILDCHYEYFKYLLIDYNGSAPSTQIVTNLIADQKVIAPYFNSLVNFYGEDGDYTVTDTELQTPHSNLYKAVSLAYNIDIQEQTARDNSIFAKSMRQQLKRGIEYLYQRKEIIGLKFGKYFAEIYKWIGEVLDA